MRRVERMSESVFGLDNSTVDANRFYSILLDARAASVSENMCDIAEKLLQGEKDNAKAALEQLWSLKKSLVTEKNGTIDLLITFYQDKMDVLRGKEEHLKTVSRDSRKLLEEKRKRDEEVASVKQQIADCTKELSELTTKLDAYKIKEQELILIEHQLKTELNRNENEIVNGLYEIILAQQDDPSGTPEQLYREGQEYAPEKQDRFVQPDERKILDTFERPEVGGIAENAVSAEATCPEEQDEELWGGKDTVPVNVPDLPPFPKSVVKTTKGRVIGEYFYEGKAYKNERHYIFNTAFFSEKLLDYIKQLKQKFDLSVYAEMLQMIQDAYKRITDNTRLHFEVATNEILNEKTLKQLWQDAKLRSMVDVERLGMRLRAKIDALGNNYIAMLHEQMQRCTEV